VTGGRRAAARSGGAPATLTLRDLNRATLARQLLLERAACAPLDAVERVAGLQAQLARPPFVGLWTRVHGFTREQLRSLAGSRRVVRATLQRGTLHLVSADDYRRWRAPLQPMLDAGLAAVLGARVAGLDVGRLLAAARELLAERPRPFDELRPLLAAAVEPGTDPRALGYAVRVLLPLVQLPADGAAWGWDARAPFALADAWLGAAPHADARPHDLVRRYLAAFGPATPADAGAWSGLRGLRQTFDELRPELVVFRDERGRELFDLPDAPRPGGDAPAPVRFLPDFDNLVLAHDDRTRVLAAEHRARITSRNLQVAATVLVDGFVAGTWRVERTRAAATLRLLPFATLPARTRREVEAEGEALLAFVEPDSRGREVRFEPRA